jgi:hypothetical protein
LLRVSSSTKEESGGWVLRAKITLVFKLCFIFLHQIAAKTSTAQPSAFSKSCRFSTQGQLRYQSATLGSRQNQHLWVDMPELMVLSEEVAILSRHISQDIEQRQRKPCCIAAPCQSTCQRTPGFRDQRLIADSYRE